VKRYIFRRIGESTEVCEYGDKHRIVNWERIIVTKTEAVSLLVLGPKQTYAKKRLEFRRPIWRSESGELFIEAMSELGSDHFINAADDLVLGSPPVTPCRVNGELVLSYSYAEWYYRE